MRTKLCLVFFFFSSPVFLISQVDSTKKMNMLLDYSLEELMNVEVVSASVSKQTLSAAPSTVLVITSQQIDERGYEELSDVLRDVPGIDLIHLHGYVPTYIYFRGMYGADNLRALLMIDGIPENNIAGTNNLAGPAYSLHNVERIEIIYGPSSSVYGANAFGGAINIITKKAETINGLKLQRGQGNLNTSFEKAAYGIKKGPVDLSFSGSLYRTEGPIFKGKGLNYSGSYVDNAYSFSSSVGYSTAKSKALLGFRTFRTPMGWGQILNNLSLQGGQLSTTTNTGTIGVI
jgi:outer membrane receptor for ferrienterochelin and colicins